MLRCEKAGPRAVARAFRWFSVGIREFQRLGRAVEKAKLEVPMGAYVRLGRPRGASR
jgi:hypothetical protein